MKNSSAFFRLVIWSIVLVLLVLFLVNSTLYKSSFNKVNSDSNKLNPKHKEVKTNYNKDHRLDSEKIVNIDIKLSVNELIIKEAHNDELKVIDKSNYNLKESEKIKVEVDDNSLRLSRNDKIVDLDIGKDKYREIEIYLPKSYNKDLLISNSVGDIEILSSLKLNKLNIDLKVGSLDVKNEIDSDEVIIKNLTGDIDVDKLISNKFDIKASVGSIDIKSLQGLGSIEVSTGDITSNIDKINGDILIKGSLGDVDIKVSNNDSFNLSAKSSMGDIETNLELVDSNIEKNNIRGSYGKDPKYKLDIICSMGDLSIIK